jgi:transcriptional regulator with XRE-family HTH domain
MLVMSEMAARLGAALRRLREQADLTQIDLAIAVGESQSWVSRRENAETEATPSEIARWERATGNRLGTAYDLVGLAEPGVLTRSAIETDPLLSDDQREIMLSAYDTAIARHRRRKRPAD